jgi:hypothetical protein
MNTNTTDDERSPALAERTNEEMVVDFGDELARLRHETQDVADACHEDAPATGGFLEGVVDDLEEARRMLAKETDTET